MQLDLGLSRQARDAGIERVLENAGVDWKEAASDYIAGLPHGYRCTGEEIRNACTERGIVPHHPNAWGGLISGAIKSGLLVGTGEYVPMKDKRSHARKTQVLRRAA